MSNNMFQTEIKFITDFTLNNVKKLGAFFTFERLLEANIHPAIKQYINAEFEFLIYEDRQKLIQGSLFDYSGPKIHHHFSMIADEIKKTKKVSYEDMKILISRAVSFNVSYVLKPNWSLQKLIFGEKKSISISELELVLNYLYYYDYLKNVFKSYLSKRNIVNLSSTEFELILNKIDRELFSVHFEKLVDNYLLSIADFFSIGGLNKRSITVETVEIFLKEKNLIDHLLKLKRSIPNPAKRKYDIDDIRRIIYSATPVEPETISPTTDETDSEVEGDFQKVKTLEEAEIKSLAADEEIIEEENKSDENIIQELIEDEIVKQDIEDLIESDETQEEEIKTEHPAEKEIEAEDVVQERKKKKKKHKAKETEKEIEKESEIISEEKVNPETVPVEDDHQNEVEEISLEDLDNSVYSENKPTDEQKDDSEDKLTEDNEFIIDEEDLLDEKDEEELFTFYEEELKDIEDDNTKEEVEINLEDVPLSSDEADEESSLQDELSGSDLTEQTEDNEPIGDLNKTEPEYDKKNQLPEEEPEITIHSDKPKKKRDIFSFLTSREIDKITDTIFNSDSEDFANTVEKISECDSFDEATEILKSLFTSSKISPQSKQAVIFTNAIANYFEQV